MNEASSSARLAGNIGRSQAARVVRAALAEAIEPIPAHSDQPCPDQARANEPRADQARADQARPDQARADQPRADQPRADQARPDQARPRVHRPPTECGDLPFLIRRDGSWLYRGSPIGRKELVCLFASVLKREADGSFWLETPAERGRIEVEDAPFVAVELDWSGDGHQQMLSFRTNVDQVVTAGREHPIRVAHDMLTCEPTPYITVREGAGDHAVEARINRAVYYELVALAVPEWVGCRRMLGVWSCGKFFPLGELPLGDQ